MAGYGYLSGEPEAAAKLVALEDEDREDPRGSVTGPGRFARWAGRMSTTAPPSPRRLHPLSLRKPSSSESL
eukprot:scaffold114663_cov45-Attheya_sp.AAC.2